MATPLLRTKLHIPPYRPELVPRPSLIERLDAGIQRKLTLVSAPAGFGKTTLLSEWAHRRSESTPSLPIAWLSLDEDDNDPARFLAYLIAALETIGIQLDKAARRIPFASITTDALGAFRDSKPPPAGFASRNETEGIESVRLPSFSTELRAGCFRQMTWLCWLPGPKDGSLDFK